MKQSTFRKKYSFLARKLQKNSLCRRVGRLIRPGVEIKIADKEDLEKVEANLGVTAVNKPSCANLVAKWGRRVIGFVGIVDYSGTAAPRGGCWRHGLFVKSMFRGMGVGEMLCRAAQEEAARKGCTELFLTVRDNNHPAIALNRKLGFEPRETPRITVTSMNEGKLKEHVLMTMAKSLSDENVEPQNATGANEKSTPRIRGRKEKRSQ